jgi:hypothetical protein
MQWRQCETAGDLNGSPDWGYDAVQRAFRNSLSPPVFEGFSPHGP